MTTARDIIDIAAQAMYTQDAQDSMSSASWDDIDEDERDAWRRIAEAGIAALRDAKRGPGRPQTMTYGELTEAYTAALAEIDRLRTERDRLRRRLGDVLDLEELPEDHTIVAAVRRLRAEAGRLRAQVKRLSARVREWEAVNADLAERCISGDIPVRLGERYSQAVLREIDRLRAERDQARSDVCGAAAEADDARRDIDNLRDGLVDALEMGHATDDDDIIDEARAANQARTDLRALRRERDALRAEVERAREIAHSYRHEIGAAQVSDVLNATPDTGSTP